MLSLGSARGANYSITTGASSGGGSLSAAITNANANPGADTIGFGAGVTEVVLTGSLPTITGDLSITGPTVGVVRSSQASNNIRIFDIASGVVVSLSNLTLSAGNIVGAAGTGGAINNNGILTLTNCLISGNSASNGAGVFNGGTLTANSSTFRNNTAPAGTSYGGAISNTGTLTLNNCSLGGNSASNGGAIYNSAATTGAVSLDSTSIAFNQGGDCGGFFNAKTPSDDTNVTLKNTIVAGNTNAVANPVVTNRADLAGVFTGSFNFIGIGDGSTGIFAGDDNNRVGSGTIPLNPQLLPLGNNGGTTPTFALQPSSPAFNVGSTTLTTDQRGSVRPRGPADDIGAFELSRAPIAAGSTFSGRVGQAFSGQLSASDADGDVLTYGIVSGSLPPGLSLNTATGAITGTPTALANNTTITYRVSDGFSNSNTATVSFDIKEPGSLIVDTNLESTDSDGKTSLNEAVIFANSNPDASAITFNLPEGSRLITLTKQLPNLFSNLSITGPTTGGGVTVRRSSATGTSNFGIFNCTSTVTLAFLTISGGNAGADNGGGISNSNGTLTVTNCTLSGNSAFNGGGVYSLTNGNFSSSSTTLRNCTLVGNTATGNGSDGGGLFNENGKLVVESCTVTGNFAPSGTGAGAASYADSSTRIEIGNSIIAGNFVTGTTTNTDVAIVSGSVLTNFASNGYNLIGDGSAAAQFTGPGDQAGVADANLKLAPLANNGGPTQTRELLAGSPAINGGDATKGAGQTDQRGPGFDRVKQGRLDIGAFESNFITPIITVTIAPSSPNTNEVLTASVTPANFDTTPTYNYTWKVGGVTKQSGTSPTYNLAAAGFGDNGQTVTLTVTAIAGAQSASGFASVTVTNAAPVNVGVTPFTTISKFGVAQTLTATYSDPNGATDIKTAYLLVRTSVGSTGALFASYDAATNRLFLQNDGNTAALGGFAPGSDNVITNSQGSLNCKTTTVNRSGNILTIGWSLTPSSAYRGIKNVYLYCRDYSNASDGYDDLGDWLIKSATNSVPQNVSLTPENIFSSENTETTLTITYSDADTTLDIKQAYVLVRGSVGSTNALFATYNATTGLLYLQNDANTVTLGGFAPGSDNVISNSQGSLNCQTTTVTRNGNNLTIEWQLKPAVGVTGTKNVYGFVRDSENAADGFDDLGDWTVFPNEPAPPIQSVPSPSQARS